MNKIALDTKDNERSNNNYVELEKNLLDEANRALSNKSPCKIEKNADIIGGQYNLSTSFPLEVINKEYFDFDF